MPRAVQPTRARTHPAPRCGLGQRIAGAHAELASRQDVLRPFRAGRPRLLRGPGGRSPAGADGFPVSSPSLHDTQPEAAPFSGAGALAGSGVGADDRAWRRWVRGSIRPAALAEVSRPELSDPGGRGRQRLAVAVVLARPEWGRGNLKKRHIW